ncbi:MAG TPA: DUF2934 domain-containing protein [Methylophilus sp.]|nr:DUF2934 domain-containing protein [Methylophilus sp.]HQQ33869.1 DUF2934 domain-containing protein [Methylophilus sp.]
MATTKTTTKTTAAAKKPAAPKKTAAPKAAAEKKPVAKKAPARKTSSANSPFERYKMIEVAAYYLAEKDGFKGYAADYWIAAEQDIDKKLTGK